MYIIIKIL